MGLYFKYDCAELNYFLLMKILDEYSSFSTHTSKLISIHFSMTKFLKESMQILHTLECCLK